MYVIFKALKYAIQFMWAILWNVGKRGGVQIKMCFIRIYKKAIAYFEGVDYQDSEITDQFESDIDEFVDTDSSQCSADSDEHLELGIDGHIRHV